MADTPTLPSCATCGQEECATIHMVSDGHDFVHPSERIEQPPPGGLCDRCGHFALRHDENGCVGIGKGCKYGCRTRPLLWAGREWPRPHLPAPMGLQREDADQ